MSFFKSFLTNKSVDMPLESKVSGLSRETVETNPRNRSLSSCNVEEIQSTRTKTGKEENRYLNLVNQELNAENETLKDKISDLKMTVDTNKQLLEEFIGSNSKMDRTIKLLKSQVELMSLKLRENNIDFDEHLNIKFDEKKLARSNSPTVEGPLSTLTTERIAKGVIDDKSRSEHNACATSLSGNHSDDKYSSRLNYYNQHRSLYGVSKSGVMGQNTNELKPLKKVVKKKHQREGSIVSSSSSQNINSYRTAPVIKPNLNTHEIISRENELLEQIENLQKELEFYKSQNPQKLDLEDPKCALFEDDNNEEFEEPISFRDNLNDEDQDNKLQIEVDSDFDYEQFQNKLEKHNKLLETKCSKPGTWGIKIKKLSKLHDKDSVMKLFDHLESQLNYAGYFDQTKKDGSNVVYLEDDNSRVWEIRRNLEVKPRDLDSLSSLRSLDSPISISSENLKFETQDFKNNIGSHCLAKLSIDTESDAAEEIRGTEPDVIDYNYQVTLKGDLSSFRENYVIDYQSMKGEEDERQEAVSFEAPDLEELPEINCFDLY